MEEKRVIFTKEMKKTHKILIPSMAPIHFSILKEILLTEGYDCELLTNQGHSVIEEGLKYVHNDTCYPALLVIGQMIDALKSGKYDLNKVALIITQTGGGCRASNYIHMLRKALKKAEYDYIPVISLNLSGLEKNSGFKMTFSMLRKCLAAVAYGDMLMLLSNQLRPYEVNKGESDRLVQTWIKKITDNFDEGKGIKIVEMAGIMKAIVKDFSKIKVERAPKVKVGITGEIYVKYAKLGNNNLEEFLAGQDCEVMLPGMLTFLMFKMDNRLEDIRLYGGSKVKKVAVTALLNYVKKIEKEFIDAVHLNKEFIVTKGYAHIKSLVKGVIGYGNKMGEGWLLTAEMLEFIEDGYPNIICTQPFGCLPNHICGKGMIRKLKELHPEANIVPIDYDASATKVNQENRIKLMLSIAREKIDKTK